jgi:hypothetical protein
MKNISISSKFFYLIIFFILFSFEPAIAQKLKSGRVGFSYKTYPSEPLPSYIKNYYIEFSGEGAKDQVLTGLIKDKLKFGDLELVENKEAGNLLLVHLIINQMTDKSELLKSKVEKIKSKIQGQEDKEITKYHYEVTYKMPIEIRLELHGDRTLKMPPSKILSSKHLFNTAFNPHCRNRFVIS